MPAKAKGRRGQRREKIPRAPGTAVHQFVRRWDYGTIGKAAADAGFATTFSLTDLPNYTEFTNLFDRWRLKHVELLFVYQQGVNTATFCFPMMIMSTDLNDAVTPLTESTVLERENTKTVNFSTNRSMVKHNLTPRTLVTGSGGLVVEQKPGTWVDCAAPGQPYYGFKAWIGNYNTAVSGVASLRLYLTYHLEFQTAR